MDCSKIRYNTEDSPGHFERAGIYLKQLRERKETRSCDMILILNDEKWEKIHAAVACAHSSKIARMMNSTSFPVILDLSRYPAYAIHNICSWLYNGAVSISSDPKALKDHLQLADILGVVFLHRQLEQTLRNQLAQKGRLMQILNVASCPSTGVSVTTIFDLVLMLAKQQMKKALSPTEVSQLTLRSVVTLVSSRVKQVYKAALINVAILWLRFNTKYIDLVIEEIVFPMNDSDMNAFRLTIISAIRNPKQSGGVYVTQNGPDGSLAINIDPVDLHSTITDKPTKSSTDSQDFIGKKMLSSSEISFLPADDEVFGHLKYSSNTSYTGSSGSSTRKTRSYTKCEMKEINKIPNVFENNGNFVKWERPTNSWNLYYSPSDIENINKLNDHFVDKLEERDFTRSELSEIKKLPDVFNEEPKKLVSPCPDCQMKSPSTTQLKTHGKREDRTEEMADISNFPDSFSNQSTKKKDYYGYRKV